eukprot:TRINITY_DN3401_c0_g1_i1.p1 TRINITY_DN3401_c0_g1~~TRINITY_DN3401_c0_g1_i1.p1  ORF type:complete len:204 (+),score=59.39 TRINITY_DN3401_c0_g1_i1:169-780(+)
MWVDGGNPPRELLEHIYHVIVNNEIKMMSAGDPCKKGIIKGIHADHFHHGHCFVVLNKNELSWYKNPKKKRRKGRLMLEDMKIKRSLGRNKVYITSTVSKNVKFSIWDIIHGDKEVHLSCSHFTILTETEEEMNEWANKLKENQRVVFIPDDNKNKPNNSISSSSSGGGGSGKDSTSRKKKSSKKTKSSLSSSASSAPKSKKQ